MGDESDTESTGDSNDGIWSRTTAPQSPYSSREISIGIVVLVIGLLVVFGIPLMLT